MILSSVDNPLTDDVSSNAPNFDLYIEGVAVPEGIRRLVKTLEYESTDGMADMAKGVVIAPSMIPPKLAASIGGIGGSGTGDVESLIDSKLFQPGNTVSIRMGYGAQTKYIGSVVIRRVHPSFPQGDIPFIEWVGYTRDSEMISAPKKSKKKKGKGGRRFKDVRFSDAVIDRARDYGFATDVDQTHDAPHDFIQKVGLKDFDFVQGISNLTGFIFWVDADEDGTWILHFKDPDKLSRSDLQEKVYTFKYNAGDFSSLLSFEPELVIQDAITQITVQTKNVRTGKIMEVNIEETNDNSPETLVTVSGDTLKVVDQAIEEEHTTGSDIKLFIGEYSFEAVANRRFTDEADLVAWAKQWYRRQRQNFMLSSGTTIGTETLMSRQTHNIDGVGKSLSGEYYFTRVAHKFNADGGGYLCDFNASKIVPKLP